MQEQISKSKFKAHALEIMRDIEQSGDDVVITSHGKPTLVIKRYTDIEGSPLDQLRGSVIQFNDPMAPVAQDDWSQG
jgi:prevent-host-death family protein